MIENDSIQEVLNAARVEEVLSEFITLKKQGAIYKALCPFHSEKTPSFVVSPQKEIYKCFGCGKSGNSVTFLMDQQNLSFVEAIRWLAEKYHITLKETFNPGYQQQQSLIEQLGQLLQIAQTFYEQQLWESDIGKNVGLGYLRSRQFSDSVIRQFKLGFAPDHQALAEHLITLKTDMSLAQKAGLVNYQSGRYTDTYRERIIFPIRNRVGKTVGLAGRLLKTHAYAPKYINSPENELYQKSKLLYNFHGAYNAIVEKKEGILVEGYTDAIRLSEAGFTNVVASAGTAFTSAQIQLLAKAAPHLLLLYDSDNAGIKAAERVHHLALEYGLQVFYLRLPEGEDPDSFIMRQGAENFAAYLEKERKNFLEFQIADKLRQLHPSDIDGKNKLVQEMADTLSHIYRAEDFEKLSLYAQKVAHLLALSKEGFYQLIREKIKKRLEAQRRTEHNQKRQEIPADLLLTPHQNAKQKQEYHLIRLLLFHGSVCVENELCFADFLFMLDQKKSLFTQALFQKIFTCYKDYYHTHERFPELSFFQRHEDAEIQEAYINLSFEEEQEARVLEDKSVLSAEQKAKNKALWIDKNIKNTLTFLQLAHLKELAQSLEKDLSQSSNAKEKTALLKVLMDLQKKRNILAKNNGINAILF